MNLHLFLHVLAWAALLIAGFGLTLGGLQVIAYLLDPKVSRVYVKPGNLVWLAVFIVSLAYLIAS